MRRALAATATAALALALVPGLLACKKREPAGQTATGSGAAAADPWGGSEPTPTAPRAAITRPLLWKAEKDGVTTWLFGTMHLGVDAERQLPAYVFDKLTASRTFVMEADTSDPALALAMQRTDGGSLRADLGAAHWKKLEDEIGAGLARGMDGMKPFATMTVIIAKDLPMTAPMDGVLAGRARAAGKPIHYLEQGIDQIAIIDPWMTAADIKALLDHREQARAVSRKLLDAYLAGDEVALDALFDDTTLWVASGRSLETFPAYLDAILGQRNRAWVPQLEKLHAEGGAFVAVGAGHLAGPGSVNDLLAGRGFTITRVTAP
ncbi:MAG: TraB/GumN family protein [Kofleriaceae bacterium]|nr:TraB/GumN family protein [Kofleriaceae bacterium]MCL4223922.1 TraB/GumN family protein [Myxococcales bacterium]